MCLARGEAPSCVSLVLPFRRLAFDLSAQSRCRVGESDFQSRFDWIRALLSVRSVLVPRATRAKSRWLSSALSSLGTLILASQKSLDSRWWRQKCRRHQTDLIVAHCSRSLDRCSRSRSGSCPPRSCNDYFSRSSLAWSWNRPGQATEAPR